MRRSAKVTAAGAGKGLVVPEAHGECDIENAFLR
jgi:hypothetical protein